MARSHSLAKVSLEHLFAREVCGSCTDTVCPTGTSCIQKIVNSGGSQCYAATCTPYKDVPGNSAPPPTSTGPNVGAIVGAVIGGLAFVIAIVTFLVWKYWIKARRPTYEPKAYDEEVDQVDEEKDFEARRDQRASTHTVGSIASTVLTRASNIIQIAYIPGVTNRAPPSSPNDFLVPPVPPIPLQVSNSTANSPSPYEEQHFFVPGDLRGSTYSGYSGFTDRTSFARTSYAPRASIASTIFGKHASVHQASIGAQRLRPAVISVKSTAGSTGSATPPVPNVDRERWARPVSPSPSTFSVGSTFLSQATAATATRGQLVRVASGKKVNVNRVPEEEPAVPSLIILPPDAAEPRSSTAPTVIEDTPAVDQGPFSDPPKQPQHKSNNSLSALTENNSDRTPRPETKSNANSERDTSPFGDEHATKD